MRDTRRPCHVASLRSGPSRWSRPAPGLALAIGLLATLSSRDAAATPGGASEPPLVVIVDPYSSPIARRLKQEIEALGFTVSIRPKRVSALDQELSSTRAIAAIEVRPALPGQVELVMIDPRTADLVRQLLPMQAREDPAGAELVATRTVELLRAARLELEAQRRRDVASEAAPSPPPEPAVAPESPAPSSRRDAGLRLGGGGAVNLAAPWSLSSSVWLGLSWLAAPHWAATAEVRLPLAPARLQSTEGTADASSTSYRLGVLLESSRAPRFGAGASAGLQLERLAFRGKANAGYGDAESQLWTLGPWLGVAATARLTSELRVVAAVAASAAFTHTVVRFAGREVDRFGQPTLSAALGLEWTP